MSWFADLAGKAETLLTNLDEQTGAALRNHNVAKPKKHDKHDYGLINEPPWAQKKRPTARNLKKASIATETKSSNFAPTRKLSPTSHASVRQPRSPVKDSLEYINRLATKKSPTRRPMNQFSLEQCPKTLVGDIMDGEAKNQYSLKQRRLSLPADLELLNSHEVTYQLQNLGIENAMLKNELNVMNREVSELLDRLRKTEDGNIVVHDGLKLTKKQLQLDSTELQNKRLGLDMEAQNSQLVQLKHKIYEITNNEIMRHRAESDTMETEISLLKEQNEDLEEKLRQITVELNEKKSAQIKLETDLRHSQSVISELQINLEKSTSECRRLEKDWEAYKLRVKGMLFAKDNEIKALQGGVTVTEDTKTVMEDLEKLKKERDALSEAVSRVQNEYEDLKQHVDQLETKHTSAERIVGALRDALKEERAANNRAQAQNMELGKEMKALQIETGQTIATLRTALREKENEIEQLQNANSSLQMSDSCALNVADYDVTQEAIDNDRVHCLTEALVQKQGRIDSLLADNNILKIQLEKLESKYKAELQSSRAHKNHVVHLQDNERRARSNAAVSPLSGVSVKLGVIMKRNPVFRIFIVIYMIGLHLWVFTVLLTSTPDGHMTRTIKT